MARKGFIGKLPPDQLKQGVALGILLLLTILAIAGPTGLLAWSENAKLLDQRKAQIAMLREHRDELRGRVNQLDPNGADPDLVGELLRKNLNVVHPDEVVITLDEK